MATTRKFIFFICLFLVFKAARAQSGGTAALTDSATIPASLKYRNPSFFTRLFLGSNYRTAWEKPVTLPVFHLNQMGFRIKELGGGQQTKSLRLLDKSGHEWALRTIDKDVEKALPPKLQNTFAKNIVQNMISAAHPYAPLTLPPLLHAAGIVAAEPQFFMVPDDPELDSFRNLFKNTICMLEDREPTPDGSETKSTADFVADLLKNTKTQVDQQAVLRARLLDMLIGDWDRHQDQWRWGVTKTNNVKYGYAIPRDRDQAYFYSKGLLVKLARLVAAKHLVGFAPTTQKLKALNAKSWNFDRTFLNQLDEKAWQYEVARFTAALPDTVLENALRRLPPEVYSLHAPILLKKLKNRRNGLQKDALRYQRFLASTVTIVGTDAPDRFVLTPSRDSVTIEQFAGDDFKQRVYRRTFHRKQTYAVTIVGLGGADEFSQVGKTSSRIKLVLDGGKGKNSYALSKTGKLQFFDSPMDDKAYAAILKKALKIKD